MPDDSTQIGPPSTASISGNLPRRLFENVPGIFALLLSVYFAFSYIQMGSKVCVESDQVVAGQRSLRDSLEPLEKVMDRRIPYYYLSRSPEFSEFRYVRYLLSPREMLNYGDPRKTGGFVKKAYRLVHRTHPLFPTLDRTRTTVSGDFILHGNFGP